MTIVTAVFLGLGSVFAIFLGAVHFYRKMDAISLRQNGTRRDLDAMQGLAFLAKMTRHDGKAWAIERYINVRRWLEAKSPKLANVLAITRK